MIDNSAFYEMVWRYARASNAFGDIFRFMRRKKNRIIEIQHTMPPIHRGFIWE